MPERGVRLSGAWARKRSRTRRYKTRLGQPALPGIANPTRPQQGQGQLGSDRLGCRVRAGDAFVRTRTRQRANAPAAPSRAARRGRSAATVPCQVRADLSAPFLRSMTGRRTSQPCHVHDALCRAARLRQRQHPVDVDERDGTSADRGGGTPGPCRAACSRLCPTRRLRVVYSPPRHAGRTACAGAASEKSLARAHCPCASVPTGVVSHLRPPPSPAARVYKCPSRAAPDPLVPPPIRSAHHPAHAGHALRLACAACPRRTCSRYRGAPARSPRRGRGAPPAAAGPWNARPALRALASGTAGTADGRLPA